MIDCRNRAPNRGCRDGAIDQIVMFGSNFPVCSLSSSFDDLVERIWRLFSLNIMAKYPITTPRALFQRPVLVTCDRAADQLIG